MCACACACVFVCSCVPGMGWWVGGRAERWEQLYILHSLQKRWRPTRIQQDCPESTRAPPPSKLCTWDPASSPTPLAPMATQKKRRASAGSEQHRLTTPTLSRTVCTSRSHSPAPSIRSGAHASVLRAAANKRASRKGYIDGAGASRKGVGRWGRSTVPTGRASQVALGAQDPWKGPAAPAPTMACVEPQPPAKWLMMHATKTRSRASPSPAAAPCPRCQDLWHRAAGLHAIRSHLWAEHWQSWRLGPQQAPAPQVQDRGGAEGNCLNNLHAELVKQKAQGPTGASPPLASSCCSSCRKQGAVGASPPLASIRSRGQAEWQLMCRLESKESLGI